MERYQMKPLVRKITIWKTPMEVGKKNSTSIKASSIKTSSTALMGSLKLHWRHTGQRHLFRKRVRVRRIDRLC